jgi:RNA polymerase sigma-B factor
MAMVRVMAKGTRTASRERADEARLFQEYRRTRDPRIRERLIRIHAPLARALAARFLGRGEAIEDLTQVGILALIQAVDAFEPERGLRFYSYAIPTIVGALRHYFRDKGWHLTVPRRLEERRAKVMRAADTLSQELGHPPTIAEIAAHVGATEEETLQAMDAGSAYEILPLDTPLHFQGDETETASASELVGSLDPRFEAVDQRLAVRSALAALDPPARELLDLRFIQDLTQDEVARRLGISQMQVSRLQRRALNRLGELLSPSGGKY